MKAPIFVYEPVDLSVFASVELAEKYLEPVDVKNNEFLFFDAEGRVLEASVVKNEKGIERVVINERGNEFNKPGLRQALVEFFARVGYWRDSLEDMELSELVEESQKFATK